MPHSSSKQKSISGRETFNSLVIALYRSIKQGRLSITDAEAIGLKDGKLIMLKVCEPSGST